MLKNTKVKFDNPTLKERIKKNIVEKGVHAGYQHFFQFLLDSNSFIHNNYYRCLKNFYPMNILFCHLEKGKYKNVKIITF